MFLTISGNQQVGYTTNFNMAVGETVAQGITLLSAPNMPLNINGYTLKMQINFYGSSLLLNTTNGGLAITNAVNGLCTINIASATTAGFVPGTYPYDFWTVSPGGIETQMFSGSFIITQNQSPVP